MRKQYQIDVPVNAAFQHPYYHGRGAGAITSSEGHYYYHVSHDRNELEDDLIRLAVAVRGDHLRSTWKHHFSIRRVYNHIDVEKAKPALEKAVSMLNKGDKVNLDDLLKEPPKV